MNTVRITRQYRSTRSGELADALTAEGWAALLDRIAAIEPVSVREYATDHGTGVDVEVTNARGPRGAAALHSLACDYGALAVIR